MVHQNLEILDLLPEQHRRRPNGLYILRSAEGDKDEMVQGLYDWVNFLREEACFDSAELGLDVLQLYQAAGYHHNIYNDHHALYFHNLRRNDKLVATFPLIEGGLAQLSAGECLANFREACQRYHENSALWEVASFSGGSIAYSDARKVMADVDQRYMDLHKAHDLDRLIADAILRLPGLRFVSEADLHRARDVMLRSSPRRNERVAELIAQRERRQADEAKAEKLRVRRALNDPIDFATEALATMAGYTSVISMAEGEQTDDDGIVTHAWPVVLRLPDGGAQHNYLVKAHGKFALFDFRMESARAVVLERDIEKQRLKLLAQFDPPSPTPPSGFRRIFGTKI